MGKSDQKKAQNAITASTTRNLDNTNAGIGEESARVDTLQPRSDAERAAINTNYSDMAANKNIYGSTGNSSYANPAGSGSSGGSSGGGGGAPAAEPDYLSVFKQLSNPTGGFDPTRLSNITGVANKLRDTSGNFGATDTSINGLQDFAKSGGLSADQLSNVNRDTLKEFEQTGGYNDGQVANIRSRANSAVPSFYQNLKDDMGRKQAVQGNLGPGWDRAGFKLARDSAHQGADTARDTEIGIADAIRSGRMDASKTLAANALSTNDLQSRNTLSGYGTSGSLDLQKQAQISKDAEASGNLDLNTQGTINQARLGGASGISQDTLGRMSIGAQSGSAAAGRAQQQSQWEQEMAQRDRYEGSQGLLNTYQASPSELLANQNLLRGYRTDQMTAGQNEVDNRINASRIPGIGSTIASGVGIAGQIAGIGGGLAGAYGNSPSSGNASNADWARYSGF